MPPLRRRRQRHPPRGAPGLLIQVIVRVVFAVLMGIFLWVTLRHLMEQTMPPSTDTPPPQVQPH